MRNTGSYSLPLEGPWSLRVVLFAASLDRRFFVEDCREPVFLAGGDSLPSKFDAGLLSGSGLYSANRGNLKNALKERKRL